MRQQIHGDSALMNGTEVFMEELSQANYTSAICHVRMHRSSLQSMQGSPDCQIHYINLSNCEN